MTTITTEKIEQMRSDMRGAADHCAWAFRVSDLKALLDLAQRAMVLQPQEGQALCHVRYRNAERWDGNGNNDIQIFEGYEVCEAHERGDDGSDAIPVFAPDAFQLALPAAKLSDEDAAAIRDLLGTLEKHEGTIERCAKHAKAIRALLALPAGPVPKEIDWRDSPHMSADTEPENAYAEGWNDCRKAMMANASSPAVALPVADERVAFEEHIASEVNGVTRLHRFPTGTYGDEKTQTAWRAWQARAALCPPAEEGGKS